MNFFKRSGYFCAWSLTLLLGEVTGVSVVQAKGSKPPKSPPPRVLKKMVSLGKINAKGIQIGQNGSFDLEYAINRQFASAVLATNRYTVKLKQGTLSQNPSSGSLSLMAIDDSPQDPEVCLPEASPLRIGGEVISFEFESANGVKFGYNAGGIIGTPSAGVAVRIAKSNMSAVFEATDGKGELLLASTSVNSKQTQTVINADVSFFNFLLGYEHFKQSPLSNVSYKALSLGVGQLANETDRYPWEAMVIATETRRYVAINAGVDAGVKVGDQFQIRNVQHLWKGTPCMSEYLHARPERAPVAIVTIDDVQATYSWAEVTEFLDPEQMVQVGAKVSIEKLVQPTGK